MPAPPPRPLRVVLYRPPESAGVDLGPAARWLSEHLGPSVPVEIRHPLFRTPFLAGAPAGAEGDAASGADRIAGRMASVKIRFPSRPLGPYRPLDGEVDFERRKLAGSTAAAGILYDAIEVQAIARDLLPAREAGLRTAHVVVTTDLIGTYDEADRRYHARAVLLGFPTIVSLSGLQTAPAMPRDFYYSRHLHDQMGTGYTGEVIRMKYGDRVLQDLDPRIPGVLAGYALMGILYQRTGEAFCPDPDCRLFDAHTQEALIRAQVESAKLCARHRAVVRGLAGSVGPGTGGRATRARRGRRPSPRPSRASRAPRA